MKCKVQGVYKNIRYRILTIDGEQYMMDMGHALWKMLFPFFYWIFLNPVFKLSDPDVAKKLKSPEVDQIKSDGSAPVAVGISILISTMLKPLADILALPDNLLVNTVIFSILVLAVLAMVITINNRCKKKIQQFANPEKLPKEKLWIRPQSFKHFLQIFFTYIFALGITLLLSYFSIVDSDVITLFFTLVGLGFLYIVHGLTAAVGQTTVKFKK